MKFLFKRSRKEPKFNEAVNSSLSNIVAWIYCYLQRKWADWMRKQTAKLSIRNQAVVLGLFIVSSCSYSVYLIARSFYDTDSNFNRIAVKATIKPVKAYSTDAVTTNKNNTISKKEWIKMIRFRAYIDSLGRSPTGKKVLDSIKHKDSELLERLARIENYYQSNFKNDHYGK